MSEEESVKFGNIEVSGKDIVLPGIKYDRMAIGNRGEMLLLSIVAEGAYVKQLRAILNGGAKCTLRASGGKVRKSTTPSYQPSWHPNNLYATSEGYDLYTQKLGLGTIHAMFITRMPGFMKVVSADSLWNELNDVRFTTPILPEWMGYIVDRLVATDLLSECAAFNATCATLSATTKDLDKIVREGIKSGKIRIPVSPPTTE